MDIERRTRIITDSHVFNRRSTFRKDLMINAGSLAAFLGLGWFIKDIGLPFLQKDPTAVPVDKNRTIDTKFTYPSITGWRGRLGVDIDQTGLALLKEHEIEVGHDLLSGRVFSPVSAHISLEIDKNQPGIGIKEDGKLIDYRKLLPLPDDNMSFLPIHLYHGLSRVDRLVHLTRLDQVRFRAIIKGTFTKLYQP